LKEQKTVKEIVQEYGVHTTQIGLWKNALLKNASQLFEVKRGSKTIDPQSDPIHLYAKIGQLNSEQDWLKKVKDQPLSKRQVWIDPHYELALVQECRLASAYSYVLLSYPVTI
jgi:transposase-like protein